VAIVLLVDHFKPKKMGAFNRMQHAAEVVASEARAQRGSMKDSQEVLGRWQTLLLDIRPDYLSVPFHLRESVERLTKPLRQKWKYNKIWQSRVLLWGC
jgi:hypothetical protein